MAYWDISAPGASLEYDTLQGQQPAAARIDDTHILNVWQGDAFDGFIRVFSVNTGDGTLTGLDTALEFDTVACAKPSIIKIDSTHFLVLWQNSSETDQKAQVFTVNTSTWAVTANGSPLVFESTYSSANHIGVSQYDNNHFLIAYTDGNLDAWAQMLEINTSTWAVTEVGTPVKFDAVYGTNPYLSKIDSTHFLVVWGGDYPSVEAQVLAVDSGNYNVSALGSPLAVSAIYDNPVGLERVDDTHFLIAYNGFTTSYEYVSRILTVNTGTWAVTNETEGTPIVGGGNSGDLKQVSKWHFALAYTDSSGDGQAQNLRVNNSAWTVGTEGTAFEFDATDAIDSYLVEVTHGYHVVVYNGTSQDGFMRVLNLNPGPYGNYVKASIVIGTVTYSQNNSVKANIIRANEVVANQVKANIGGLVPNSVKADIIRLNEVQANSVKADIIRINEVQANNVKANILRSNETADNSVKANIIGSVNNSVKANILAVYAQDNSVKADIIRIDETQNNNVKANILRVNETAANSVKANIVRTESANNSVKANIVATTTQDNEVKANILAVITQGNSAKASIKGGESVNNDVKANVLRTNETVDNSVKVSIVRTESSSNQVKANIVAPVSQDNQVKANILKINNTQDNEVTGNILRANETQANNVKASIVRTETSDNSAKANIVAVTTQDNSVKANILRVNDTVNNSSKANILRVDEQVNNATKANIVATTTQSNSSKASIVRTEPRDNEVKGNILTTYTQDNAAKASIVGTLQVHNNVKADIIRVNEQAGNSVKASIVRTESFGNSAKADILVITSQGNSSKADILRANETASNNVKANILNVYSSDQSVKANILAASSFGNSVKANITAQATSDNAVKGQIANEIFNLIRVKAAIVRPNTQQGNSVRARIKNTGRIYRPYEPYQGYVRPVYTDRSGIYRKSSQTIYTDRV